MACLQIYQELLLYATFLRVHSNSKDSLLVQGSLLFLHLSSVSLILYGPIITFVALDTETDYYCLSVTMRFLIKPGSMVFLYNKLPLGPLSRMCQKTLLLKTFVFFPRFFLYQKHWNLKRKKKKEKQRNWPICEIRSL